MKIELHIKENFIIHSFKFTDYVYDSPYSYYLAKYMKHADRWTMTIKGRTTLYINDFYEIFSIWK